VSIGGIIAQFGKCLFVYRPDFTVASDGQSARAYSREFTIHGFIQPGAQSSDVAQGRENGRTTTTIYVEGCSDVRIADEIHDKVSGTETVKTWRVTGVVNPGFLGDTGAAAHLNHTEIECVEVEPEVTL
jgi:hypothetical protein